MNTNSPEPPVPETVITAEWLRDFLTREPERILRAQKMPSHERLTGAANELLSVRDLVKYSRGSWKEGEARRSRIQEAAATLAQNLPPVLEDYRRGAAAAYGKRLSRFAEQLEALMAAVEDAEAVLHHMKAVSAVLPSGEHWRDVAPALMYIFTELMAPQAIGFANNGGPGPRFVAAVIPHITGETPSVQNVAQCLKEITKQSEGG